MAYGICFLWSIWDMGIGFPDTDAYKAYPICDTLYLRRNSMIFYEDTIGCTETEIL